MAHPIASSAAAAAAAVTAPPPAAAPAPAQAPAPAPTDFWSQLEQKKVAGIGGSIPGAGVYLQQQAAAEEAFQQAKAQAQAQKNRSFQQFGLLPSGEVDPNSQFGDYQNLLHDQAVQFNQADELAQQHNLGSLGLGAQGESDLRYTANNQDLAFQRQVTDAATAEQSAGQSALTQRNQQFLDALTAATQNADAQKYAAAAAGGGYGADASGGGAADMTDFRYGASIPQGYSDEMIYSAAVANAPDNGGAIPMHIMNQGMVQNGMISIKYRMLDGTTNTIWVPIGAPQGQDQSQPAPTPTPAPAPAPAPASSTAAAIKKLTGNLVKYA